MRRVLSYLAAEVSNGQTTTALLICLCAATCCASAQSVTGQGDACPPLSVQFHNYCYTFVSVPQKNSLSIEPSRELCRGFGADIISIGSKEENSFLVKMFQIKWKDTTEVLLGMFYDSDDSSLKWFDKSEVTFLNWGQVKLVDNNLNTCVKMDTQSGLWDITDCDNFYESAVLCKSISKENRTFGNKAVMITLITTFAIIILVLPIVVIFYKRKNWSIGLQRAEVLPYSDDAVLVDTMEREDYA